MPAPPRMPSAVEPEDIEELPAEPIPEGAPEASGSADATIETATLVPAISEVPASEAPTPVAAVSETPVLVAAVSETPALVPETPAPARPSAEAAPRDDAHPEAVELVPSPASEQATPDPPVPAAEQSAEHVPPPVVVSPQVASTERVTDPSHASGVTRIPGHRAAIAAVLVAVGFVMGRLTAAAPDVTSAPVAVHSPTPPETTSTVGSVPIKITPPPPAQTVAPLPAAPEGVASAPHGLVEAVETPPAPVNPPAAAHSLAAPKSAADGPRRIEGTARPAATARSERVDPTIQSLPPSAPQPVNPFVQAVQDDIKEDEATPTKR